MNLLAQVAYQPTFLQLYLGWIVATVVVVLGLFVYGFSDTRRLLAGGFKRAWAISSVCFADAVRRKVMILPVVAMLGIIVVSQLQKPLDEQDAIRLDIKFCFFTTALLVTITTIILAATNLPREIDNRVIFTIVTKPVTRLEIILGKLIGFAKVSGAILLAMFLFSLVYLNIRSAQFNRQIAATLENPSLDAAKSASLRHTLSEGLLNARDIGFPTSFQVYARVPATDAEPRWMIGDNQQAFIRVHLPPDALVPTNAPADIPAGAGGVVIALNVAWEKTYASDDDLPSTVAAPAATRPPLMSVQILDRNNRLLIGPEELKSGALALKDAAGKDSVNLVLNQNQGLKLASVDEFVILIAGTAPNFIYGLPQTPVTLIVPDATDSQKFTAVAFPAGQEPRTYLRGAEGRFGQQLRGKVGTQQPVSIFRFRNAPIAKSAGDNVTFEVNLGVENGGDDASLDDTTIVSFQVYNRATRTISPAVRVFPENDQTTYFEVPKAFVAGDFDVLMRNESAVRIIDLDTPSVALIAARQPFAINLFKGLLVIWFFSILVTTIALCCSTRLSWPISIVLTLLILLARWGVLQLQDTLQPGIGAAVVTDFGGAGNSAPVARVMSSSVEALTRLLLLVASVVPDISQFGVTDRIENGLDLGLAEVLAPLQVLLLFGLPLVTVAYVFLRNKEVAP